VTIYDIATKFSIRMHHLSVYEISRQLDNAFVFYNNLNTLTKRRKIKMKKLSQFSKAHILA